MEQALRNKAAQLAVIVCATAANVLIYCLEVIKSTCLPLIRQLHLMGEKYRKHILYLTSGYILITYAVFLSLLITDGVTLIYQNKWVWTYVPMALLILASHSHGGDVSVTGKLSSVISNYGLIGATIILLYCVCLKRKWQVSPEIGGIVGYLLLSVFINTPLIYIDDVTIGNRRGVTISLCAALGILLVYLFHFHKGF